MSKLETIYIKKPKCIFLSDIHFGIRSSLEEWQDNIKDYFDNWFIPYIKSLVKDNEDYCLFILGDVFDDSNRPAFICPEGGT